MEAIISFPIFTAIIFIWSSFMINALVHVNNLKNKNSVSDNYKIVSTNSEKLLSNFSFVINKDITIVNSGQSNSVYKPAYTLYYPRTRDEFEVNIYVINFDVAVFASAIADIYAVIKN